MVVANWIVTISVPIACYLVLSGLDDLAVDLIWWWQSIFHPPAVPSTEDLDATPQRRIAIFVPLWHEHQVIEQMLSHNLATVHYSHYTFFVGVYPNDLPTCEAAQRAAARFPNVRICSVPHPGPTSKADCLNWIYQQMLLDEDSLGVPYEIVLTHDAEDMIHAQALRWINYYMTLDYDFVQVPVLALKTPPLALTHGIYCDEFAEMHTRDLTVRSALGAFVPSAGVGTGYSRRALEALAEHDSNQIFIPECLTEDYENGLRLHELGFRQKFVPILKSSDGTFMATREYFPQSFIASVKQRTRWVTGIALQSWQRNGWGGDWMTRYWLWRDRKGLIGSPLGMLTSLLFVAGLISAWHSSTAVSAPPPMKLLFATTTALGLYRIVFRMGCVARVYGGRMAAFVPVRIVWANWINGTATLRAIIRYLAARSSGTVLSWTKTTHEYPSRAALLAHRLRLGEILIQSRIMNRETVDEALNGKPPSQRLGEHLICLNLITERQLYESLALQQQLPLADPDPLRIPRKFSHALPAHVVRQWKVIAFAIDESGLHLCSPEPPTDEMAALLRSYTSLTLRFHLVTESCFAALSASALKSAEPAAFSAAAGR